LNSLTAVGLVASAAVLTLPPSVGAAPAHAPRTVPNVVGLSKAQVYAAMHHSELYFRTTGPGSANGTWTSVVTVSPRPGTRVAWHATVTLITSLRRTHGTSRVPRLTGRTKAQVYAALRKAQLYFRTTGARGAHAPWIVVRQSPAPGTVVRWRATVVLTVRTPRPIPVRAVTLRKLAAPKQTTTTTRPVTTTTRGLSTTTTTTTIPSTSTTYPGETTTSTLPPTTTTTSIGPVTTTTVKPAPVRFRIGLATWYSYFPGRCATSYLPMGTRITVRNVATGRTVHCVVTDRQGSSTGRVVDLSVSDFAQLMPLWRGVVLVKVSW